MSKKSTPGDGQFARGRKGMPSGRTDGDYEDSSASAVETIASVVKGLSLLKETA